MTVVTATAANPTSPDKLPQFNGRPVPWVARWTGEVIPEPAEVSWVFERGSDDRRLHVGYPDGHENREASGILWLREGVGRTGEPVYADFNTYRQRASMTKRICQVCGDKINDRVITWLLSSSTFDLGAEPEQQITTSPPTCASCVPLAQRLCPHLRADNGGLVLRVLDYEVWGVQASGVVMDEAGRQRVLENVSIQYGRTYPGLDLTAVVAKQQIVRLTKWVVK